MVSYELATSPRRPKFKLVMPLSPGAMQSGVLPGVSRVVVGFRVSHRVDLFVQQLA